jgi:CheY-like chemotaxis protein
MMVNVKDWHILVVEDEYDSIQMISIILRHHGAEVHIARNGRECLEALEKLRPTLIIMDLALPEMDGWETLEKIRANIQTSQIPVVAITAYHSVNVAEDAYEAGFDAYFSKPLDTGTIVESLADLLKA